MNLELTTYRTICWVILATGVPTFIWLMFVSAPYGRHSRGGFGPMMSARLGWILMESPAVLWFAAVFAMGAHRGGLVPLVLLALWMLHYVHRTYIFPFRIRATGRQMPVLVAALAFAFQMANGTANAAWISDLGVYDDSWLIDPRFLIGAGVFLSGLVINWHADTRLLNLRKPGETGYKIPRGGLFRWVSCPNYLGECLEWIGWAIATWSLAGVAFAVYTLANLVPRAIAHHRWYREKFGDDYPAGRRALLPGVL